ILEAQIELEAPGSIHAVQPDGDRRRGEIRQSINQPRGAVRAELGQYPLCAGQNLRVLNCRGGTLTDMVWEDDKPDRRVDRVRHQHRWIEAHWAAIRRNHLLDE